MDPEDLEDLQDLEDLRDLVHLEELVHHVNEVEIINDTADQRRRWWVRPINQRREEQGASEQLVREMRLHDDESFFNYTRMTMVQFDRLLTLVGPLILKQNTRKDVLSPYVRLLITLR